MKLTKSMDSLLFNTPSPVAKARLITSTMLKYMKMTMEIAKTTTMTTESPSHTTKGIRIIMSTAKTEGLVA